MSVIRGCFGVVRAGAGPTVVGEMRRWEYSERAERIDTSIMGNCTKRFTAGAKETTGRLSMWWNLIAAASDPAGDAGQDLLNVGDSIALELHPNGTGTGKPQLSGTVTITDVDGNADVATVAELTVAFALDGEWTKGAQA